MEFLLTGLETLGLLVLIVLACTVFTNGIEWFGHRLNIAEGAIGSILAAVGTALPETLVPLVAIFSGAMASMGVGTAPISQAEGHEIGIGAILGAPFLLSTLAMAVTALAAWIYTKRGSRTMDLKLDAHLTRRDLHYFFVAFAVVVGAGFIQSDLIKHALAVGLLLLYGFYLWRTLSIEHVPDAEFDLDPLMFQPARLEPTTAMIILQVLTGLAGIILLAHLFVEQISHLSGMLHIDALVLSLIIVPIATELPEKFNSVLWIGKGKDNLAMGNITGAMVFQSCIPGAVGLALTPWHLEAQALMSITMCLASSVFIYVAALRKSQVNAWPFLAGGVFYLIYLAYIFTHMEVSHG